MKSKSSSSRRASGRTRPKRSGPAQQSSTGELLVQRAFQLLEVGRVSVEPPEKPVPRREELVELIWDGLNEAWSSIDYPEHGAAEALVDRIIERFALITEPEASVLTELENRQPIGMFACGCVYDWMAREFATMCETHRNIVED